MKKRYLYITGISVVILGAVSFIKMPVQLIYTPTTSAPRGYYLIVNSPPQKGEYVLANIPEQAKMLAEKRGYLPINVSILKPVAAQFGDHICVKNRQVFLNARAVSKLLPMDSKGRNLTPWKGCRLLKKNEYFLLSTYSPHSFDSRYFGPVTGEMIIGKALPFWIFEDVN